MAIFNLESNEYLAKYRLHLESVTSCFLTFKSSSLHTDRQPGLQQTSRIKHSGLGRQHALQQSPFMALGRLPRRWNPRKERFRRILFRRLHRVKIRTRLVDG